MRNAAARALRDEEHREAAPVRRLRLVEDDGDRTSIRARPEAGGASTYGARRVPRDAVRRADYGSGHSVREAGYPPAHVAQQAEYVPTRAYDGRRSVKITGQPVPPRRRRSPAARQIEARPDRIALWAVLLGLFLVVMAAATANAASL